MQVAIEECADFGNFNPCLCTTADTRQNRASQHDTQTELEERPKQSPLLLGRMLDRGRGASGNGAVHLLKQFVWAS